MNPVEDFRSDSPFVVYTSQGSFVIDLDCEPNLDDALGCGSTDVESAPNVNVVPPQSDIQHTGVLLDSTGVCPIQDYLHMEFDDEREAFMFYNAYALKRGFSVREGPSINSRVTKLRIRRTFFCHKQGCKKASTVDKTSYKRRNTRSGCLGKLVIVRDSKGGPWRISIFRDCHNHTMCKQTMVKRLFSHNSFHRSQLCRSIIDELAKDLRPVIVKRVFNKLFSGVNELITTQNVCDRLKLLKSHRVGDECAAVFRAFIDKNKADPTFFFAYDYDDDFVLKRLFWADRRCIESYAKFSDVVVFDVTYRTNKFGFPFAPFTGVNHHFQSTLFGCAFLSNEREESFIWLFQKFLECMSYKHPRCILTDQDHAICSAVSKVFNETRHRYCIWHFNKHYEDHMKDDLGELFPAFDVAYKDWFACSDIAVCEEKYAELKSSFNISDDSWFHKMYLKRHHWLPCMLNDVFWAGMKTTQRAESINAFFDGFVNAFTPLSTFVQQYDSALAARREAEAIADCKCLNSEHYRHEKILLKRKPAREYTGKLLILFEEQWDFSENLKSSSVPTSENGKLYCITNRLNPSQGEFKVEFDGKSFFCLRCSCSLFETKGIPCMHILHVMRIEQFDEIPDAYILKRWSKSSIYEPPSSDDIDFGVSSTNLMLLSKVSKVLEAAKMNASLKQKFDSLLTEFLEANVQSMSTEQISTEQSAVASSYCSSSDDDVNRIRDPICPVKTKGRPKIPKRYISHSELKSSHSSKDAQGLNFSKSKQSTRCSKCHEFGHNRATCERRQKLKNNM